MVRWGSDASAASARGGRGEVVGVSCWEVAAVSVGVGVEMAVCASVISEGVEFGDWFIGGGDGGD